MVHIADKSNIALVSRDYNLDFDFLPHLNDIIKTCNDYNCNVVVFAMWSFHSMERFFKHHNVFFRNTGIDTVIMESGDITNDKQLKTEIWQRDVEKPKILHQLFAKSNCRDDVKHSLVNGIRDRILGRFTILLCGEVNIMKWRAKEKVISDDYGFWKMLKDTNTDILISTAHDYMVRHEMKKKRCSLSKNNRHVLCVWNSGKIADSGAKVAESKIPWLYFYNEQDLTSKVVDISSKILLDNAIRIGKIII